MKTSNTILRTFGLFCLFTTISIISCAQTKADIFNEANDITWLGLDYTQAKLIGSASQFKDAGDITNSDFRDKYVPAWNQIFIDEQKKYDVASAVHRSSVKYAIDITDKTNAAITNHDFFSNNPDDYKKLDEEKIKDLVKKYDFKDKTGVGLLFFIDGMSKGKKEAGAWVTFVDMKTKTLLLTQYMTGKASGIGFRAYWINPIHDILKDIKSDYDDWKK